MLSGNPLPTNGEASPNNAGANSPASSFLDIFPIPEGESGDFANRPVDGIAPTDTFPPMPRHVSLFEGVYHSPASSVHFTRAIYLTLYRATDLLSHDIAIDSPSATVDLLSSGPAALANLAVATRHVGLVSIAPTTDADGITVRFRMTPVEGVI